VSAVRHHAGEPDASFLADFLGNCAIAFRICPLILQKCVFRCFGPDKRRRTLEIVPVANVTQRADKASVSRAVVELVFDPAVAFVEKFDQEVEHVHGFCGTVGVARIAAPDLRVSPHRIVRVAYLRERFTWFWAIRPRPAAMKSGRGFQRTRRNGTVALSS
jgi:hypothetical protein